MSLSRAVGRTHRSRWLGVLAAVAVVPVTVAFAASGATNSPSAARSALAGEEPGSVTVGVDSPLCTTQLMRVGAAVAKSETAADLPTGWMTFHITGPQGAVTPSPVVALSPDADNNQSGATYVMPAPPAEGQWQITASYGGDSVYGSADSLQPATTTVSTCNADQTALRLTADPPTAAPGAAVTFTAHVGFQDPGKPNPVSTDDVWSAWLAFYDGESLLGYGYTDVAEDYSGAAMWTVTGLSEGTHHIRAVYPGNWQLAWSSTDMTYVVGTDTKVATSTKVSVSPQPVLTGQKLTVTATVSPAETPLRGSKAYIGPTGTVTFRSPGSAGLNKSVPLVQGVARLTLPALPLGTRVTTAAYSGDDFYAPSSGSAQQTTWQAVARINAGGAAVNGWSADTNQRPSGYLSKGTRTEYIAAAVTTGRLQGPVPPAAVFHTERWDPASAPEMHWSIPAAKGTYVVYLYFAETYPPTMHVGARVFSVLVENSLALRNFDIYAAAGGANRAVARAVKTTVKDGRLTIDFRHGKRNPEISAIAVYRTS